MVKIQLNPTGTHFMEVPTTHFEVIKKYALFQNLIDSTGYVTDEVLEKLKLNVRSLLTTSTPMPEDLYHFFTELLMHDKMKAYGLEQLMVAYHQWTVTEE